MTKKPDIAKLDLEDEIVETAAADTIAAHNQFSRSELLNMAVAGLAAKDHEELTKWYYDSIEQSKKSAETIGDDLAAKNKASVSMKPSGTGANPMGPFPFIPIVREDVKAIFDGQELSEDLLDKAATLFEAAINARVVLEATKIQDEFEAKLDEAIEDIRNDIVEKVDSYLDYAVNEWMTENEVAIENAVEIELVREFQNDLADLIRTRFVELPDERLDVVEELNNRLAQVEEALNAQIKENIELQKDNDAYQMMQKAAEVSEGLTVIDQEKFKTLIETVEFTGDVDDYAKKISIIKEANFKQATTVDGEKKNLLTEGEGDEVVITVDEKGEVVKDKSTDPNIKAVASMISRISR
jgi:hypothetical protein